jgi:saccharopine dehydrogenase-like NADP-dependent oxidoreductase
VPDVQQKRSGFVVLQAMQGKTRCLIKGEWMRVKTMDYHERLIEIYQRGEDMTIEITYTERQQADELSRMENVLNRMAYSKNEIGMRYEGHEEAAMALTHVRYLIHELKLRRCTDGEGHVSHEFFADSCTRCGSSL